MRLRVAKASAEDTLMPLVAEGYDLASWMEQDYTGKRDAGTFDPEADNAQYANRLIQWGEKVRQALLGIFPSSLEWGSFIHDESAQLSVISAGNDRTWFGHLRRTRSLAKKLEAILKEDLGRYTDLPTKELLYIEDIDSFSKARDVNPQMVLPLLVNGRLEELEDDVQIALETILGESFHRIDHGGEVNDLFTTHLRINGQRVPTAFMLKGRGLKAKELTIGDCGANGDQLVRLMDSPAELFVVQFIGAISDNVIRDMQGKMAARRQEGKPARFCIINGTDTARIMVAYGALTVGASKTS